MPDVAAMLESIQRCLVRLENDMLELKAATPKAQWQMFKALENDQVESDRRDAEFIND
jgi:hypothetical protein